MNCSTPGLPVHHQLPDFTQTHVLRVGDAIQLSHPLSSPLLLPAISSSIRVFSNESALSMRWPKYWSFSFSISPSNEHPGLISFRMDWLDLLEVQGTPKSLLQHHRLLLWCKSYSATLPYTCVGTLSVGRYQVSIFSLLREKLFEIWVFTFLCHIALSRIMKMYR